MKKIHMVCTALAVFCFSTLTVSAAELQHCPESWDTVHIDGDGTMMINGVDALGGAIMFANPDYGWPTEMAIAMWRDAILHARDTSTCVTIYYDPNGNKVWSVKE